MEVAAAVVLVVLVVLLVVVSWRFATYRATHPYQAKDLEQARRQSIKGSHSTLDGKAVEHLAPFLTEFCERFDANDARFLGSPIDYVVFDGLCDGDVRKVVFVEVKTGDSAALSKRERQVRTAVKSGRVDFETLHADRPTGRVTRARRAQGAARTRSGIRALEPPE